MVDIEDFKEKQRKIYRPVDDDLLQQIGQGKKFIPVGEDFPESSVPEKYMMARVRYRDSTFTALVPRETFFYMANPGEGDDLDGALDDIAQLYGDVKQFEKSLIANGDTSVQEADWSTMTRDSYSTYLINKLTHDGKSFTTDIEKKFGTPEVQQRMKAIAALALGKPIDEIRKQGISEVLVHRTPIVAQEEINEQYKKKENVRHEVRCYAGSHYEMRTEYRVEYVTHHRKAVRESVVEEESIGARIGELESEILDRVGRTRHDRSLMRQYVNLAFIAKENPGAQLDISPAAGDVKASRDRFNQGIPKIKVIELKSGKASEIDLSAIEQVGAKFVRQGEGISEIRKLSHEYTSAAFYRQEHDPEFGNVVTFYRKKKGSK